MRLINAECIWDHSICYDIECDKCSFADGEKCKLRQRIQNVCPVDAEPVRHGHWVSDATGDCCYRCSECQFLRDAYSLDIGNYCPNCGAKMDEVSE